MTSSDRDSRKIATNKDMVKLTRDRCGYTGAVAFRVSQHHAQATEMLAQALAIGFKGLSNMLFLFDSVPLAQCATGPLQWTR